MKLDWSVIDPNLSARENLPFMEVSFPRPGTPGLWAQFRGGFAITGSVAPPRPYQNAALRSTGP